MRDIDMIKNVADWPAWPYLPIKRPAKVWGQWPECRTICAEEPLTVIEVGMYGLPKTREEFDALPRQKYESAEAIVADGWVVD